VAESYDPTGKLFFKDNELGMSRIPLDISTSTWMDIDTSIIIEDSLERCFLVDKNGDRKVEFYFTFTNNPIDLMNANKHDQFLSLLSNMGISTIQLLLRNKFYRPLIAVIDKNGNIEKKNVMEYEMEVESFSTSTHAINVNNWVKQSLFSYEEVVHLLSEVEKAFKPDSHQGNKNYIKKAIENVSMHTPLSEKEIEEIEKKFKYECIGAIKYKDKLKNIWDISQLKIINKEVISEHIENIDFFKIWK
jgi:hypothetical protein